MKYKTEPSGIKVTCPNEQVYHFTQEEWDIASLLAKMVNAPDQESRRTVAKQYIQMNVIFNDNMKSLALLEAVLERWSWPGIS